VVYSRIVGRWKIRAEPGRADDARLRWSKCGVVVLARDRFAFRQRRRGIDGCMAVRLASRNIEAS
jgi:hypothetical protein